MTKIKQVPDWASSMVSNWRRTAQLPENLEDRIIYDIIVNNSLQYGSGYTKEENLESINFLRQELGLGEIQEINVILG